MVPPFIVSSPPRWTVMMPPIWLVNWLLVIVASLMVIVAPSPSTRKHPASYDLQTAFW